MTLTSVSLFSGAGGFELGFDRAGIRTILQAECDPWALAVLRRHYPDVERVTDVRQVDASTLQGRCRDLERNGHGPDPEPVGDARGRSEYAARADLVFGGFPCQDVSVAGKRAGLSGERSGLWSEFRRVLSELRPRWVVAENVPGLLSSGGGRDFARILRDLEELGYGWSYRILDARFFGVPQRRRRVFIVGCLGDSARAAEVLALCESCGGHPAPSGAAEQSVAYTLSASVRGTGDGHGNAWNTTYLANTLEAPKNGPRYDGETETFVVANSVQATGVRRLTPRECERLMGWPDDWTRYADDGREIPDSHRYRLCGNGVVATVAEWIGHRLVAIDSKQRDEAVA